MTTIHLWLWGLAGALVGLTALLTLPGVVLDRPVQRWTDRCLLAAEAGLLIALLSGPLLLVAGHQPADPLHFLYAGVALLALPIARAVGGQGRPRRRAGSVLIGCLVLAGVLLRLFQTG
ncbi:MAG TPA: hypothetical protein VF763_14495 [Candidatus Limnocylindrales bacterium]